VQKDSGCNRAQDGNSSDTRRECGGGKEKELISTSRFCYLFQLVSRGLHLWMVLDGVSVC